MTRILANDGISSTGKERLEKAGFTVDTTAIPQDQLSAAINEKKYEVLLVRSATKVRKDIIDSCPDLKMIGRGGVGMDNIDVEYARSKGIEVFNTPAASSQSVAELTLAHLFSMSRFLHDANRKMPSEGNVKFKDLKKSYSKGRELNGSTLGIIGFGRIGKETAKMALGLGMKVITFTHDTSDTTVEVKLHEYYGQSCKVKVDAVSFEDLLKESNYISLHVPFKAGEKPLIGKDEIAKMKDNVGIINAARGGAIDENALLDGLNSGKLAFAGIDVFENEPSPMKALLEHEKVSLSPHIGASTGEAQERIGLELADIIINFYQKN